MLTLEEAWCPLNRIVNPIPPGGALSDGISALLTVSTGDLPQARHLATLLDETLDTPTRVEVTAPSALAAQVGRARVLDGETWFGPEHLRNSLRLTSLIDRIGDIEDVLTCLTHLGLRFVRLDFGPMIQGLVTGWRAVVVDYRLADGLIAEHQITFRDFDLAGAHERFCERWRMVPASRLSEDTALLKHFQDDLEQAKREADLVWAGVLWRLGLDRDAFRREVQALADRLTGSRPPDPFEHGLVQASLDPVPTSTHPGSSQPLISTAPGPTPDRLWLCR